MASDDHNVCVVVPVHPSHLDSVDDVLDSTAKQSRRPDSVVLALSETAPAACDALRDQYGYEGVRLTCVDRVAFAAENRNRGAGECGNADVVTFMDADDLMAKNRIERVLQVMDATGADAVYHSFQGMRNSGQLFDADAMRAQHELQKAQGGPLHLTPQHNGQFSAVHHGHLSVTRDTFSAMQQDTTEGARRCEDSLYARALLDHGRDVVFIDEPLSEYRAERSTEVRKQR